MAIDIISQVADTETLKRAWQNVHSGKSEDVRKNSKGIDSISILDYEQNIDTNLKKLANRLKNGTYKMQELYGFLEKKKNKKFRLISAPTVEDRVLHTAILQVTEKFFPEIRNGSSYCLPRVKGSKKVNFIDAFRTIINEVKKGKTYIFESDIESFFDAVNKEKLYKIITDKLPDKSINKLIQEIIYFTVGNINEFKEKEKLHLLKLPNKNIGLCQGSPLSPLFANIYLMEFDQQMIKKFGKCFIRYVDDFIVLCETSSETKSAYNTAKNTLSKLSLTLPLESSGQLSKTKTAVNLVNDDSFTFLGINVNNKRITPEKIGRELVSYINNEVITPKKIREKARVKEGRKINNIEMSEIINRKIKGTVSYYQYFHTKETIDKLNTYLINRNKKEKFYLSTIKKSKKNKELITKDSWQKYFV